MKKTIYLLMVALFTLSMAHSQSLSQVVVASSGATISNASNSLAFTLGEPVVGNIDNGESLGQGFWLGAIEGVVLSNEDFTFEVKMTVYPNPVLDYLNVDFRDMAGEEFEIELYDITGKQVFVKHISNASTNETLDFYPYSNGTYLLTIVQQSTNKSKTFKIIKQ